MKYGKELIELVTVIVLVFGMGSCVQSCRERRDEMSQQKIDQAKHEREECRALCGNKVKSYNRHLGCECFQ